MIICKKSVVNHFLDQYGSDLNSCSYHGVNCAIYEVISTTIFLLCTNSLATFLIVLIANLNMKSSQDDAYFIIIKSLNKIMWISIVHGIIWIVCIKTLLEQLEVKKNYKEDQMLLLQQKMDMINHELMDRRKVMHDVSQFLDDWNCITYSIRRPVVNNVG